MSITRNIRNIRSQYSAIFSGVWRHNNSDELYDWIAELASPEYRLFILCGGGSAISVKLKEHGIGFRFTQAGREIETLEGSQLAQRVLENQKALVEKKLHEKGLEATVFLPVISIGDKSCHMNGDSLIEALHPNFGRIFVVTLKGRTKTFPQGLDKIEVVHL